MVVEFFVDSLHLLGTHTVAVDGVAGINDLLYALAQTGDVAVGNLVTIGKFAVESSAQRVADMELAVAVKVANGLLQNERYGTLINAIPLEVGDVDKTYCDRLEYFIIQLLESIVDLCGQ